MSSLFGNPPSQGKPLFTPAASTGAPGGSSLFGNPTTSASSQPSLFGSTPANQNTTGGGGLFGNTATQNAQPNTGTGLFGNTSNQTTQASTGPSLFGNTTNQASQPNPGTSLFGNTCTQNTQNAPSTSLFGGSRQQPQNSLHPSAQNQLSASAFTGFNPLSSTFQFPPGLSVAQQHELARTRLNQIGLSNQPNEKTIFDQAQTLTIKWDPQAQDTLLQVYLYNAVSSAYAPFYYRNPEEDEASWEQALSEAPKLPEDSGQRFVPVLVRGFHALGTRVEYQAAFIQAMQARLHEMNNSLTAVMDAHRQRITLNLARSHRQHTELSQRCLRLAVKVQVLRNRGYALDAPEEALRKQLLALEQRVMDPAFNGREEEIWARMVSLRERARWLEEEGKRLGQQVEEQQQQTRGVPEDVLQQTKKILKDYGNQLKLLVTELAQVQKEYAEWEDRQRTGR